MGKETFLYFAYASNLDPSTLEGRLSGGYKILATGVLQGHGFRFNHPNPDGTARANIVSSVNENVYGVIYELEAENKTRLMQSEPGYEWISVHVLSQKGTFEAFTFISPQQVPGIYPSGAYVNTIIQGAKSHGIAAGYLASLINRAGRIRE